MPEVPQELLDALRDSRARFIASFHERCDEMQARIAFGQTEAEVQPIVHRLIGLAGTVGFPTVSRCASEFEHAILTNPQVDQAAMLQFVADLRTSYEADLETPPEWLQAVPADPPGALGRRVLLVEDDPDQRRVTEAVLAGAGFEVTALPSAETLLESAHAVRPDIIVLDVMLPGIDGLFACRLVKSDPVVSSVPVVFLSSRSALDERHAAIALGAADYLTKPIDASELVFRLQRLLSSPSTSAPAPRAEGVVDYAEFVSLAGPLLAEGSVTVALIRVDPAARPRLCSALLAESRRRDVVGHFDRLHVIAAYPDLTAAVAVGRLRPVLDELTTAGMEVRAGCASAEAGDASLDGLVDQADRALAEARFQGLLVCHAGDASVAAPATPSAARRIVLADDDPDVMRIVDAQMQAQHFTTVLAFDGEAAMAAVTAQPCDLIVVDLMLPKLTGFEVLQRLRDLPHRPKAVVLSARGREEDITRAFQLGADDYVTKPFRPQELAARVVRLLR